jgi:hypothetical protein
MNAVAGLLVRIRDAAYFIPADRVGFVAPGRNVRNGRLVMSRGSLPYVDAFRGDPAASPRSAVAIRMETGFVAIGVDHVDLAGSDAAASALPLGTIEDILRGSAS